MDDLTGELDRLEALMKSFDESSRRMVDSVDKMANNQNTNTQNTTIDTGSKFLWFAIWIATFCCVVMFIQNQNDRDRLAVMQSQLIDTSRKLDVAQDKLSIVLQWAPNLRDEVNKEMKEKAH